VWAIVRRLDARPVRRYAITSVRSSPHYTCQEASCMHIRVPLTKCLWQVDCFFSLSSIASTVHIPNEFLLWPYFANFKEFAVCFAFAMAWSRLIIQQCSFVCPIFTLQSVDLSLWNFLWSLWGWRRPQCRSFQCWQLVINLCRDKRFFFSKTSS